jgi:hypothetical protein
MTKKVKEPEKALTMPDHKRKNVRYVMSIYTMNVYYSDERGYFLPEWNIEGFPTFGRLVSYISKELNGKV